MNCYCVKSWYACACACANHPKMLQSGNWIIVTHCCLALLKKILDVWLAFNIGQLNLYRVLTCRRAHGSPLLAELHWLPMEQRILFKILLYVYKCMNDIAPPYLANMVELHKTDRRGLRSSHDTTRLYVPDSRLLYGKHSFSHSAAALLEQSSNQHPGIFFCFNL